MIIVLLVRLGYTKEAAVNDVLHSETAHYLGDETETGVANVMMLIDEESDSEKGLGQERDHTGKEIGGAVELMLKLVDVVEVMPSSAETTRTVPEERRNSVQMMSTTFIAMMALASVEWCM
ncbi:predicted protein [Thalassiosira pseudonana CCMP1335]|uniref:Uncharacterized protein n=1 Tax=Thalassiosira pseudonana TaxID=35128 RepID=B8CFR6_THAPS|nr:predicted protein [Thalassiosira pseudonana CCMP1335]EED87845.1 predicted protein [Thalassiosira pseudonana CCMP1335]